jgi:hypothetical protein
MRALLILISFAAIGFFQIACTRSTKEEGRQVASLATKVSPNVDPQVLKVLESEAAVKGGTVHFPSGLTRTEAADMWHLGEGSEVFPLRWFLHMRSGFSPLSQATFLNEKLDAKYGVIKEPDAFAATHPYPLKWIGLTAAWSGADSLGPDVKLESGQTLEDIQKVHYIKNETSVAMVGVNCTFCHTGQVTINGQNRIIEGAPNMVFMRGFFQDLFGSTALTMLTPELLQNLLTDLNVPGNTTLQANQFVNDFKTELGLNNPLAQSLGPVLQKIAKPLYNNYTEWKIPRVLFKKREVVSKYLVRLFKLTYGVEPSSELVERMKWLAISMSPDPQLPTTPEGYARTDAFGRIANWVARIDHPIPLTATVSVPAMWNIEYKAQFHWNANTNSVIMRNIGQSFGLGAILTHPDRKDASRFDSTVNLDNLRRLESLVYKIQAPQWKEYFSELDLEKVVQGCNTYYKACASCHEAEKNRVGPSQELVLQKVFPLGQIGTDATYTKNQSRPVGNVPFRTALFSFAGQVRDRYFQNHGFTPKEIQVFTDQDRRGTEMFRDTYLGEHEATGDALYMNIPAKPPMGYPAPNLASAWASAPYLHNGSVPTLYDLLSPAPNRPKIFFVGSHEYDTQRVGFRDDVGTLPNYASTDGLVTACKKNPNWCFDTRLIGNSNAGHSGPLFGTNLPYDDKMALIEFLKVIRPPLEYSRTANPVYTYDGNSCSLVPDTL